MTHRQRFRLRRAETSFQVLEKFVPLHAVYPCFEHPFLLGEGAVGHRVGINLRLQQSMHLFLDSRRLLLPRQVVKLARIVLEVEQQGLVAGEVDVLPVALADEERAGAVALRVRLAVGEAAMAGRISVRQADQRGAAQLA